MLDFKINGLTMDHDRPMELLLLLLESKLNFSLIKTYIHTHQHTHTDIPGTMY